MRTAALILYVIVLPSFAVLHSCKSSSDDNPPKVRFAEDVYMDSIRKAGGDKLPKAYTVTIEQMKFQPDNITVAKGDTVVFVNQDMVTHDITEAAAKAWTSNPLPANATWKFVPVKSADYFCSIHPVMKGKITVQ
jgi:plastocyanin